MRNGFQFESPENVAVESALLCKYAFRITFKSKANALISSPDGLKS